MVTLIYLFPLIPQALKCRPEFVGLSGTVPFGYRIRMPWGDRTLETTSNKTGKLTGFMMKCS